jgi:hypothetical protein
MAIDFFLSHTGGVEIIMKNRLHVVHFPILPECQRNR